MAFSFYKSRIYSVFTNTCPVCHKGLIFKSKHSFNLKQFDKMYERCSECQHQYEKEPGFFYGAMYVSYGLMVALFVLTFAIFVWGFKVKMAYYLIGFPFLVLLCTPYVYRVSRIVWMNLFTGYNSDNDEKK